MSPGFLLLLRLMLFSAYLRSAGFELFHPVRALQMEDIEVVLSLVEPGYFMPKIDLNRPIGPSQWIRIQGNCWSFRQRVDSGSLHVTVSVIRTVREFFLRHCACVY